MSIIVLSSRCMFLHVVCNMSSLVQTAEGILRKWGLGFRDHVEAMEALEKAGAKFSSSCSLLSAFKNPNDKDSLRDLCFSSSLYIYIHIYIYIWIRFTFVCIQTLCVAIRLELFIISDRNRFEAVSISQADTSGVFVSV